jgi:hypothetical protein
MKAIFPCKYQEPLAQQCIIATHIRIYSIRYLSHAKSTTGEGRRIHGIIKIYKINQALEFCQDNGQYIIRGSWCGSESLLLVGCKW